jgi:ABC transporter substrate binding protein
MRRREFIAGLAFATAAGATRVRSAQRVFRLALISNDPRDLADPAKRAKSEFYSALFGELRRLGYAEGENLSLEWFSIATDTLSEILPEVLQSKPDVIYATMPAVLALNRASNGIPVVTVTGDPVVWGLSQSLSKPDGNVTGLTTDGGGIEMREKHLQIISELVADRPPIPSEPGKFLIYRRGQAPRHVPYAGASARAPGTRAISPSDTWRGPEKNRWPLSDWERAHSVSPDDSYPRSGRKNPRALQR